MNLLEMGIEAVERGWAPDVVTRFAIRRLCRARADSLTAEDDPPQGAEEAAFFSSLRQGPIAPAPRQANAQHYELPPEFFAIMLGPRRKYSCCHWDSRGATLEAAEDAALAVTCHRAGISNGQDILELGCGWGSLSLWMAEKYPQSRILAMSHSNSQRKFIESQIESRKLHHLQVATADINAFEPSRTPTSERRFDRIVSVEMFEHLRNYQLLLARVASWLRPEGELFVHIFCHRQRTYPFEDRGASDWMARHFFTGGIMPGFDLLRQFPQHLQVSQQWKWSGLHYQRTARAWLGNLDARRDEALRILQSVYGHQQAPRWLQRWRVFLLAVSELFGFNRGYEWFVGQYRLTHAAVPTASS